MPITQMTQLSRSCHTCCIDFSCHFLFALQKYVKVLMLTAWSEDQMQPGITYQPVGLGSQPHSLTSWIRTYNLEEDPWVICLHFHALEALFEGKSPPSVILPSNASIQIFKVRGYPLTVAMFSSPNKMNSNSLLMSNVVAHLLSCVWFFATPWTAAHQTPLPFTISWSLFKFMSIKSVMPSNPLILCHLLLLLLILSLYSNLPDGLHMSIFNSWWVQIKSLTRPRHHVRLLCLS